MRLGADLEVIEPRADSFVEDYFTPGEQQRVPSLPLSQQAWAVTLIWSAKEAALKALGKGLRLDTRSVEVGWSADNPADALGWNAGWVESEYFANRRVMLYWRQMEGQVLTLAAEQPVNLREL